MKIRKTFTTIDDYDTAPIGTIVAGDGGPALQKKTTGWQFVGAEVTINSHMLPYNERRVLRWGTQA